MAKHASATIPAPTNPHARFRIALAAGSVLLLCIVLAVVGYTQPVVLGAAQGLSEFLPISSSAHLILIPWLFGWQGGAVDTLTFDVALHLGTLLAVVSYFWQDWRQLIAAIPGLFGSLVARLRGQPIHDPSAAERLLGFIILATIPGGIAGVLLDSWAEHALRAPLLLALTLPVLGLLLYLADHKCAEHIALDQLSWRDALLIGLAQACAIIPGVSRSGVTMTVGRWRTLDRTSAARFSFLLSAPITAAAVLFKLDAIVHIPTHEIATFLVGVGISAAVGALTIAGLLQYLRRASFAAFAVYRVVVAVLIVLVFLMRMRGFSLIGGDSGNGL